MSYKHYTQEEIEFVRQIADGMPGKEITKRFNDKFGADRTVKSIRSMMSNNGIKSNLQGLACENTRFKNGYEPWNKGKKIGASKFRDEVGKESIDRGNIVIKVAQPNEWRYKSHVIWEEAHGKIPEGHVILFKDNDKMNVTLENLFMVSLGAMVSVEKRGLRSSHEEINTATHYLAELNLKVKRLESE